MMTKVPFVDILGGPEFIERCVASASDLSLLFVGESEERMLAALSETKENLKMGLAEYFGAEVAALVAEAFVTAVVRQKAELESGPMGWAVQ